jgi:hemoglobin-like flavoprotein
MSIGVGQGDPGEGDPGEGGVAARPGPEVTAAVRQACRRLFAVEAEFVDSFYASLVSLVPVIRNSTPDQGRSLAEGLARSVLWAGLTDDPADVVEATCQSVGSEYHRQGFPPDGYHGAGHALLRSARSVYTAEWSSALSSGWVAYYAWLSAHLEAGARQDQQARQDAQEQQAGREGRARREAQAEAQDQAQAPAQQPPPVRVRDTDGVPATLDDVLQRLRILHFAGNERALGGVLTRIALRTGADLRAPRPDQRANPAVVANVTAVLQVMGYTLQQVATAGGPHPVGLPTRRPVQARWWNRAGTIAPQSRWRRVVPGLFR